jgi:hypothetical protein
MKRDTASLEEQLMGIFSRDLHESALPLATLENEYIKSGRPLSGDGQTYGARATGAVRE